MHMEAYVGECKRYLQENHELMVSGDNSDVIAVAHQLKYHELCSHGSRFVRARNGCFIWKHQEDPYIVSTDVLLIDNFYDFSVYATKCECVNILGECQSVGLSR